LPLKKLDRVYRKMSGPDDTYIILFLSEVKSLSAFQ
jgi:hypothetical protein